MVRLGNVLRQYKDLTRKSWPDILNKEKTEWQFELWKESRKLRPSVTKIYADAVARGFKIGRKPSFIAKTIGGVSRKADEQANSLLGGDKSDYFKVTNDANGVFVRRVRFSGSKSEKLLRGGRNGNRFAKSVRRAKDVSGDALKTAKASNPEIKQLNKRALSVALELGLRSRGAKGGLMALQWLPKNFKRRKSSTVKTGPVVIRTSKGIAVGSVTFAGTGDNISVSLGGSVPHTAQQFSKHGIINKVEDSRVADRMAYITRKMTQNKNQALQTP